MTQKTLRNSALRVLSFFKYGSLFPKKVKLQNGSNEVCVNPTDQRALDQLIAVNFRNYQNWNQEFWINVSNAFTPTTVIDIGLNYGEIVFAPTYADDTSVIGVEGNPELQICLEGSKLLHPNRGQIKIFNALLSDREEVVKFKVDKKWSGSSSVLDLSEITQSEIEDIEMTTKRFDDLISSESLDLKRVLFKVDVEGYEDKVLKGMDSTLKGAEMLVGLVEVSLNFLERQSISFREFIDRHFKDHFIYELNGDTLEFIEGEAPKRHFDMVVMRGVGPESLGLNVKRDTFT